MHPGVLAIMLHYLTTSQGGNPMPIVTITEKVVVPLLQTALKPAQTTTAILLPPLLQPKVFGLPPAVTQQGRRRF